MALRTPSKIILAKGFVGKPFYVRYVTHGGAIKYSNIEKRLNSKGMFTPQGYNAVSYLGIVSEDDIMYPNIRHGVVLSSLPEGVINMMRMDIERLHEKGMIPRDVVLTMFIYKFKKVR